MYHFPMYFSMFFVFFYRTPPGDDFGRVQAPIYARNWVLEPFQLFWAKKFIKNHEANLPGPTWGAGPPPATATSGPKRSKTMFSLIVHRFWIDFGTILDGFSMIWEDFLMVFSIWLHTFWRRFQIGWWEYANVKNLFAGCYWQTSFVCRLHLTNQICLPAAPYKQDLFAGCAWQTNFVCWRY